MTQYPWSSHQPARKKGMVRHKQRIIQKCIILAPRLAAAAVVIGLAVLLAYWLGYERLWRPLPNGPATHPWTAFSLVALGLAVIMMRPLRQNNISVLLAILVAMITGARLLTASAGRADIFNRWSPFAQTLSDAARAGHSIEMGIPSAAMMFLLATSVFLARTRNSAISQIAAVAAAFPALAAIIGYLCGLPAFAGAMALPTAVGGWLCIFAVLFRQSHRAPIRSVLTIGTFGHLARLQIGLLVGLSVALVLLADRSGFDPAPSVLANEASIIILGIVLVLGSTAYKLERLIPNSAIEDPLLQALDGACERGEFFLVFQPQMHLETNKLIGVEALVRWRHPVAGLLSPTVFIPLAETSGYIISLGDWILRAACEQAMRWEGTALSKIKISVNVSALQLSQEGFMGSVLDILQVTGMPPGRLVIEVTESAMMREGQPAIKALYALRQVGIAIAIDDFGTGYSSLSYLRILPCDYLKIDQSFIRELPSDAGAASIVTAIVALGHNFGLRVIAEGVEIQAQADYLRDCGCDKGQGYLYAAPLAEEQLLAWANEYERANAHAPRLQRLA